MKLSEAFASAHDKGARPYEGIILEGAGFTVEAFTVDHRTTTQAYIVREKTRCNIDTSPQESFGLQPGPWLKQLEESTSSPDDVVLDGVTHSLNELQKRVIVETPGALILLRGRSHGPPFPAPLARRAE